MQHPDRDALQVECLAERLKLVRGSLGFERQEDFAERLGRSRNSISSYERGKAAPDGETLMRLASLGINIQWLLTGEGEMLNGSKTELAIPDRPPSSPLDEDFLAAIADGVASVYKQENARISAGDKGRLIARIHNDLTAVYDDPDERLIGLKGALHTLRQGLRSTPAAETGKRSA
jgi:transcriptional regulator with XRE-family HTH domain